MRSFVTIDQIKGTEQWKCPCGIQTDCVCAVSVCYSIVWQQTKYRFLFHSNTFCGHRWLYLVIFVGNVLRAQNEALGFRNKFSRVACVWDTFSMEHFCLRSIRMYLMFEHHVRVCGWKLPIWHTVTESARWMRYEIGSAKEISSDPSSICNGRTIKNVFGVTEWEVDLYSHYWGSEFQQKKYDWRCNLCSL